MRPLIAFAILLFLTVKAEAQLYPAYYPGAPAYYPGFTWMQPYYAPAYYPVPSGLPTGLPAYVQQDPLAAQRLVPNTFVIPGNNENTDVLMRRVQQLSDELRSLQTEVATTDQELTRLRTFETPPATTTPAPPVVLVLNDGRVLETKGYAVARGRLWILTRSGSEQIALSQLNVPATQKENLKRGITFPDLES
jgi:hypothetical protein